MLRTFFELGYTYQKIKPQIIHHSTVSICAIGGLASLILYNCKIINGFTGLGYIFTSNNRDNNLILRAGLAIVKFTWNKGNVWPLFQNENDYETLFGRGLCSRPPSFIAGSGIDTDLFRPKSSPQKTKKFILSCGARLVADKGICELVEAMELVHETHQNIELRLAGEVDPNNPSSLAPDLINKWKRKPNIKIVGYVEDMVAFWTSSNAAILMSAREGLPKALIEAAACGLPLIASDISGCRPIVKHNQNGYLIDPKDPRAIARSIIALYENKDFQKTAGAKSRDLAINGGFSTKSIKQVYKKFLKAVITDPSSR